MTAPSEGIACEGIVMKFGDQTALNDVQLNVEPGTVFGLLGQNGSGKTTLMKILMGLLQPTGGRVRVDGHVDVGQNHQWRQSIGYAPEKPCMFPWMRIEEVVRFVRHFFPNWDDEFCRELMERFELDPTKKVRTLSKGMAAKLSLLLAFSYHPRFLVLDEPTSGLDPIVRRDLLEIISRLVRKEQSTVLVTSHITSDIEQIADQIAILHRGEIIITSPLEHLIETTRRLRIRVDPDASAPNCPQRTLWSKKVDCHWDLTVLDYGEDTEEHIRSCQGFKKIMSNRKMNLEAIFYDAVKGNRTST